MGKVRVYSVTLEAIVYAGRLHPVPHAVLGDPYVASTTITIDDAGVANIRGLATEHCNLAAFHAICDALADKGVTEVLFARKKQGKRPRLARMAVRRE